jgi:hypothetical protein
MIFDIKDVPELTKEQAAILSAFTGIMMGSFSEMHGYAESKLGRPIFTHQFGSDGICDQLKDAARPDFVAIMPKGN